LKRGDDDDDGPFLKKKKKERKRETLQRDDGTSWKWTPIFLRDEYVAHLLCPDLFSSYRKLKLKREKRKNPGRLFLYFFSFTLSSWNAQEFSTFQNRSGQPKSQLEEERSSFFFLT
jgi:hypothetical protein